jgi:hypothetical protein
MEATVPLTHAAAERHAWTYTKLRLDVTDPWPICELEWIVAGQSRRFLRAMKDDSSWEFFQKGDLLPFEDGEMYRRKRIRDRFTSQMLWSYVSSLGWERAPDSLWEATRCSVWQESRSRAI